MKNFKKAFLKSMKTYLMFVCVILAFAFLMFVLISFINFLADFGLGKIVAYAVGFFGGSVLFSAISAVLVSKSEDLQ